jgi:hypothetical protein
MAYRQSSSTTQAREKSKREGKARAGQTKVTQVKGSKKALPKAKAFDQAAQRPAGGLGGLAKRSKAAKKKAAAKKSKKKY